MPPTSPLTDSLSHTHLNVIELLRYAWLAIAVVTTLSPILPFISTASRYGKLTPATTKPSSNPLFAPSMYISTKLAFTTYYTVASVLILQLFTEYAFAPSIPTPFTSSIIHLQQLLQPTVKVSTYSTIELGGFIVLVLLLLHTLSRCYECLFVHQYSSNSKQHVLISASGLLFYVLLPISVYTEATIGIGKSSKQLSEDVPSWNDQFQTRLLKRDLWSIWVLAGGIFVFVIGYAEQRQVHRILADLRTSKPAAAPAVVQSNGDTAVTASQKKKASNSKASKLLGVDESTVKQASNAASTQRTAATKESYQIPHGSWYEYVSMPHYTAEIIVYSSFILIRYATVHTIPVTQLLILLFVSSNLLINGSRSHQWYQQKFGSSYPTSRDAVIPYVI